MATELLFQEIAFNNYRFMAREEIKAARFLKKHELHDRAAQCLRNAKTFKKASFQFKSRTIPESKSKGENV